VKRLLVVIIVAALAYGGWWFYAAHALRTETAAWFADQRVKGWQADYADLTVRGFPNRTDLTITEPVLISPDGSLGWRAPFFQVLGLSYRQGHVIVAWPDTQTITTLAGETTVTSDGLRASVIHDDDALVRSNVEAAVLNITGPDQAVAMAEVNAALQRIDLSQSSYRLAVSVGSIAATTPRVSTDIGPDSLGSLRAQMNVTFEDPLTLDGLADPTPRLRSVDLTRSEISYGPVTFQVTGAATFDDQGRATGEIDIAADNWREGLEAARQNGDLPAEMVDLLAEMLSMLAMFNGTRDSLDVTLGLERGTVMLGPVPVGKLPPLSWR